MPTPFCEFVMSINDPNPERDGYPAELKNAIWTDVARTADEFNNPGIFTAFSAYEWTAMYAGNNLHRCVILKDGADTSHPMDCPTRRNPRATPKTCGQRYWSTNKPQAEKRSLFLTTAISATASCGTPSPTMATRSTADYAERRMRWEPIAEVTQLKGDSETHPTLSPEDPFADFERWDEYNISNTTKPRLTCTPALMPGQLCSAASRLERSVGANPYAFGMIGSTDDHTSLATAEEDNFFGKFANSEPGVRTGDSRMAGLNADWELGASGLLPCGHRRTPAKICLRA